MSDQRDLSRLSSLISRFLGKPCLESASLELTLAWYVQTVASPAHIPDRERLGSPLPEVTSQSFLD